MSAPPTLKLTYFDLPGRASVIRKVLSMGGVPFTDDRVPRDLTPLKSLLPYGKVPVLEVDGVVAAESTAILRYTARLADMLPPPSEPLAAALIDEVIDSFIDLFVRLMSPCFKEKDAEKANLLREQLLQGPLQHALEQIDTRLAQIAEYPYFQANVTSTYVHEVFVWDFVEHMRSGRMDYIPTALIDPYKNMVAIHTKVDATPSPVQQKAKSLAQAQAQAPTPTMPEKLRLSYFTLPGRAEHIRLALCIGGVAFEDERLSYEVINSRRTELPNGQVPVLRVDDTFGLAQSEAILRYVGTLTGLYPIQDPLQALKVDEIMSHMTALYFSFEPSHKERDPATKKTMREQLRNETIPAYLDSLNKRLALWQHEAATPSAFVLNGSEPTIADLAIYSVVLYLRRGVMDHIPTTIVDSYGFITKICEAVLQHPRVQDWYAKNPLPPVKK